MIMLNQGTLKVLLTFELEIHLVRSINLKKWVARVKLTKIKDGGNVFRGFAQFMAWFIALEKVFRNRKDAFVKENENQRYRIIRFRQTQKKILRLCLPKCFS